MPGLAVDWSGRQYGKKKQKIGVWQQSRAARHW
jgi:hypothetical protein